MKKLSKIVALLLAGALTMLLFTACSGGGGGGSFGHRDKDEEDRAFGKFTSMTQASGLTVNDENLQAVADGHLQKDLNSSVEIFGAKLVGKVHVEGEDQKELTITVTGSYKYGYIVNTILNEIQDAVGKKRRAADHGGDDQPFAAALDQAVEGKDAALVVVVGLHGDQHVLDCGHERHGPDDERKCAQDHVLTDGADAAVVGDDGFHGVHGARADVAVDDAERNEQHTGGEGDGTVPALTLLVLETCLQFVVCHVDSLRHLISVGTEIFYAVFIYKSSLAHRGALDNNPQLGSIRLRR